MELKELHRQYGSLMIQLEIIQNKIREVKTEIVQEMQKPKPKKEEEKK